MQRSLILLIIALGVPSFAQAEPTTPSNFIEAIEGPQKGGGGELSSLTLPEVMDELRVPGMSLAVIRNFEIDWAKGYGIADLESRAKVDTETLFQAASISKPVTAMAVLKAVEDGVFSLDTDINDVLTSWHLAESEFTATQPVTPRSLTSHTSGLGDGFGFPGYHPDDSLPTTVQILDGQSPSNVGPVFMERAPFVAMKYSGGGVMIMALALVDAKGMPFVEVIKKYVLDPVGMSESTFEQPLSAARDDNAARAHNENGEPMDAKWHVYPELAAAGLWTTPTDLAKFAIEVQKSALGRSNRVLSRQGVQEMLNPVGVGEFAVGFSIVKLGEGWYFEHGGSNWGFRALLRAHKLKGYGLIVMTNAGRGNELIEEVARRVAAAYSWDALDEPIER